MIQDSQEVKVIYRRWIIFIPILMIIIGSALMAVIGPYNSSIGLIGGMIVFIGILILGTLLAVIVGIEMGARTLAKKTETRSTFREQVEQKGISSKDDQ
ncbi:MAG: hypothetical protein ACFFDC_12670 [Promethearchaeota archaeon]